MPPLGLSLRIYDRAPGTTAASAGALRNQLWRGGATDLTTRTMLADPPRWLQIVEYETDSAPEPTDPTTLRSWQLEQLLPGRALSPQNAGGVILVSMDVEPAHDDEFNDWYNTEHIPHFSRVPGVIAARRFRALRGTPRYVALYHVENTDVYATRAWMAANETPWILRMRRFQRNRTYFMFRTMLSAQPDVSRMSSA